MIRAAHVEDIPDLVAMGIQFIRSTSYAASVREDPAQIARFLEDLLAGDAGKVFVSVTDDHVSGVIVLLQFRHPFSGQLIVSELAWWVNPEARGQGIRLLKRAERWAEEIGASWIQMVAPSVPVGEMYLRLGYEPIEVAYQRAVA